MSNDSFDINDIIYANKHSRITLKSKKKLDELAAQVALWNLETFPKSSTGFSPVDSSRNRLSNCSNNKKTGRNSIMFQSRGYVKNKAAYFEALSTPTQTNKSITFLTPKPKEKPDFPTIIGNPILVGNLNRISTTEKVIDKENIDPSIDEELPPPPDDLLMSEIDDKLIPSPPPAPSVTDMTESWGDLSADDKISDDFTRISSLASSSTGSLYDEIIQELAKKEFQPTDIETVSDRIPSIERPKKIRRSLSFNETIEYIYPSSVDNSCDDISSHTDSPNLASFYQQNPTNDDRERSFASSIHSTDNLELSLQDELESLKETGKELLETLADKRFPSGSEKHIDLCIDIIKNVLMTKCVTEMINKSPITRGVITGDLKLQKIQFSVRKGFAVINYRDLMKQGYSEKLGRLSSLFHLIMVVRCVAYAGVTQSGIYTLVKESEAKKLGLPHQPVSWLEMFYFINFEKLQAGFRIEFNLYCLPVHSDKNHSRLRLTPKPRTPLKKLFTNSPFNFDRVSFFTNIGSFELSAEGLISNQSIINKHINIPNDYPFDGDIKFTGTLELGFMTNDKMQGRLNIYMEITGIGSWHYRDCEVTHTSIICGKRSEDTGKVENIDMTIPFFTCKGLAALCDYKVCAKANSFSILIHESNIHDQMPINRRLSTDGKRKARFLAAAESHDEALRWCKFINDARESFLQWSKDVKPM